MLKFSIIIPVYNAARSLASCLNSCVRQTYSNIEVICVDDFSKDNSREIIRSFHDRDKRIIGLFHEKNESQYIARRNGIMNATGDYILFLDSDDTLRHDACKLLVNRIARTGADMIQFGYKETPGAKKYTLLFTIHQKNVSRLIWQKRIAIHRKSGPKRIHALLFRKPTMLWKCFTLPVLKTYTRQ